MLTKSMLTAAVLAVSGTGAFAQSAPSQGEVMLANLAGVTPGAYSVADLVRLSRLGSEHDAQDEIAYVLRTGNKAQVSRSSATIPMANAAAARAQLAATAKVAPGDFTAAELYIIEDANDTNDVERAAFVKSGGLRDKSGSTVSTSPAHKQLASSLHVSAADFSLAQLVELQGAVRENDASQVRAIIAEAGANVTAQSILR